MTTRQRWAPRAPKSVRAAWRRPFGDALRDQFRKHFPTGWTWLFDWQGGVLRVMGPEGGGVVVPLVDGYLELRPADVVASMLTEARRLLAGMKHQVSDRAVWTMRAGELVPVCPQGHELPNVGPAQARGWCKGCGREYEVGT